jgi:hypothetical protein
MRILGCASVSTLVAVPACVAGLVLAVSAPAAATYAGTEPARAGQIEQRPDGAGIRLAGIVDDSVSRRFPNPRPVPRPIWRNPFRRR